MRPSEEDARGIIWASLRRRCLRHLLTDDDEARRSHEIDTISYQDWIRRFDGLSREDKSAILGHIAEAELPVPLAIFLFDATTAQFAIQTVRHLRKQLFTGFVAVLCFFR